MYDVLGELCILTGALLHFLLTNAKYKISFRMYLNPCNAKFSRIDVEKRVYKEVIFSLHFSIASFNMPLMC